MEATILLPISSSTRNASSSVWSKTSAQTMRAVRVSVSSTVTVRRLPCAPHGSADDIVHVQHPAGFFGADAALMQGEHGPLRDDEQASQLGEPGDHVIGESVGGAAAGSPLADRSANGITAMEARRDAGRSRRRQPAAVTTARQSGCTGRGVALRSG